MVYLMVILMVDLIVDLMVHDDGLDCALNDALDE